MTTIKKIIAREVIDSRGNPTVEVDVTLSDDSFGRAIVPSGASTGSHEALELRDGEDRFLGKGVKKACKNVNETISKHIVGKNSEQRKIDEEMINLDGTENKSNLGANAIIGVSLALAKANAQSKKMETYEYFANLAGKKNYNILPTPLMNIINGGSHADSGLEIQEFMICPTGANSFSEGLRMGVEVFHNLKKLLKEEDHITAVGDEGGFAPHLNKNSDALDMILKAIDISGYNGKINLALDVAASEFFNQGIYNIEGKKSADDMVNFFENLSKKYPIISIEDPLDEDDFDGFLKLNNKIGNNLQIVGDDLFVTNPKRIKKGIKENIANSVLIKLNQIGTLTETIDAVLMTQKAGWSAIISHRSGESEDTTIADLAVGLETGQIKTGSLCRSERVAKYNQLLRIEEKLGNKAIYKGLFK